MYRLVFEIYLKVKRYIFFHPKNKSVIITKIIDYCEWYFNVFFKKKNLKIKKKSSGLNKSIGDEQVIISLTSYPKRITTLWLTIETLLQQKVKADKIILWLSEEQFPNKEKDLPNNLLEQEKRGLEIRFVKDDLKSHKKYFYVMQEYKEALVILVDDDTFYQNNLVKELLRLHKKYPNDIVCMTACMISKIDEPPSKWHHVNKGQKIISSDIAQAFTGSGTLLPRNCLDIEYAFNIELIKKLCPYADDLWIKYMSMRRGIRVSAKYPFHCFSPTIYGTAAGSLWYINGQNNENDKQWLSMIEFFKDK